jgi:hypothetical protein
LGLCALIIGKSRVEQTNQSKGDQGAKHEVGRYQE